MPKPSHPCASCVDDLLDLVIATPSFAHMLQLPVTAVEKHPALPNGWTLHGAIANDVDRKILFKEFHKAFPAFEIGKPGDGEPLASCSVTLLAEHAEDVVAFLQICETERLQKRSKLARQEETEDPERISRIQRMQAYAQANQPPEQTTLPGPGQLMQKPVQERRFRQIMIDYIATFPGPQPSTFMR